MAILARHITARVAELIGSFRVMVLGDARQTGKTTLVRSLLLSGSANYLADRSVAETLAARTGRLELWPLSLGERRGIRETFVDHLFEPLGVAVPAATATRANYTAAKPQHGQRQHEPCDTRPA
jgi:predicted AAA+ superfamily ATPase